MAVNNQIMTVDGIPVRLNGEKNLLEVIRKLGIHMPTFCYHKELSIYGACRLCMVENEWGGMDAACSTVPRAGMNIKTNTEKLRRYRRNILELLLADHCRDCTTCPKSGHCKLQEYAREFGVRNVRFENTSPVPIIDDSSVCITRDAAKCIMCGSCVRVCSEVQHVGAIDFAHRSSKVTISTAFNVPIAESPCVGCGQCAAVCPTGAIVVHDDTNPVWKALGDPKTTVSVQVAPAVRVGVGDQLGLDPGTNVMGKIVAALRKLGFDEIFDTSTGADLTVMEETAEFVRRMENGGKLPLVTSCCPAWIQYAEKNFPELLPNISTCRSPMQMFASILKDRHKNDEKRHVHVAIMPCTAKKFEAARDEFKVDGIPNVDYVLTTQELVEMIQLAGIDFKSLAPEAVDLPFPEFSGAGVIFGVTGGVTEAVLRRVSADKSPAAFTEITYTGVRGEEGIKEAVVPFGQDELKIVVASGLANAEKVMRRVKAGEKIDLIEIMACPGGCVNGAGQPIVEDDAKAKRGPGLYSADLQTSIRTSDANPLMEKLYATCLKDREHEMLHVHYGK